MDDKPSALLTPKHSAAFLDVSIATLWRLPHKDSDFPKPFKIAGMTRWRRADLEQYINQRAEAA